MAQLNTATRDYMPQSLQQNMRTPLVEAAILRLITPRGTYWANPLLGSDLHLLRREKDVPRVLLQAKQYAEKALQPLLDQQRVSAIVVAVSRPNVSFLRLDIEMTTARGVVAFEHYVKVGG